MTSDIFFWYVLPWLVTAAVLGWIAYDRRRHRVHPGE